MPLAVSATTWSGRSTDGSTNERTCVGELGEQVPVLDPAGLLGPLDQAGRDRLLDLDAGRWPPRPGRAEARHILMPLYWAGLWLAVNIAAGASRSPEAK